MNKIVEYTFTADQKALLKQSMELVWEREREPVFVEAVLSGPFEAARIGFQDYPEQPLFMLQSMPANSGLAFSVSKLGPPPDLKSEDIAIYSTFFEAVQKLTVGIEAIIQEAKAPFRNLRLPALGNEDRQLLQELVSVFSNMAGHQGFADFRDISEGSQACGIGVLVNGQRIVVASFVGVYSPSGFECSVRNFKNEQVFGTPKFFASVAEAISAHREYFIVIANSLSEKKKKDKPWWKKIF